MISQKWEQDLSKASTFYYKVWTKLTSTNSKWIFEF